MKTKQETHYFRGFTLVELLLVIAILAILAVIVIVAINPARQISLANNAQRRSNVNTILNAIGQYATENRGAYPTNLTTTNRQICRTGVSTSSCGAGGLDLSVLTDDELYITSMPIDPTGYTATGTGYWAYKTTSTNARVMVSAPNAELSETIEVRR